MTVKHHAASHFAGRFLALLLLIVIGFGCFPQTAHTEENPPGESEESGETPNHATVCELKIRYVVATYSEDESTASYVDIYPTYHVQLPYGYEYSVTSPTIEHYVLSDKDDALVEGTLTENQEEIFVVYKEKVGTAKYAVNYWKQEQDGSDLKKIEDLCYEGEGEVGTSVTVKLPSVPGYSWSNDDLLVYITADGKAVKNVYYVKSDKRKLVFRTGTGYAQVIEAYPGDDITEKRAAIRNVDPTKPGYQFVNWDTSIASLGEQTIYGSDGVTVQKTYSCYVSAAQSPDDKDHYYMPADDYVVNAIWTEAPVKYRVVFWFEKADGSGYANGGLDTVRYALTGTEVTAAYYDRLIADERTLFGATFDNAGNFTGLENPTIRNITTDDEGSAYNFIDKYYQPATDEEGNVLTDGNGNSVVISYENTYDNPQGKTYTEYKTSAFFGFDFDHCNDVIATADGTATLNIYYRREEWSIILYNEPSGNSTHTVWRKITGRYASIAPKEKNDNDEEYDINKLPTINRAKMYYASEEEHYCELRTESNTLFNLDAQQIFNTESKNGLHTYEVYPYYSDDSSTTSKREFFGADLGVTPDSVTSDAALSENYTLFATSTSSMFSGKIQPAFIFDENRTRCYTWEGAYYRYRPCATDTEEAEIPDGWSNWIAVVTTYKYAVNTIDNTLKNEVDVGKAKIILWEDGTAYWYFHQYETKENFYLQVILPRKKLNLNFVSHNNLFDTQSLEVGTALSPYYNTCRPDNTDTERFVGWYQDAELTKPVSDDDIMGYTDDTVYAKWEPKTCKVTFDPRNGGNSWSVSYQVGNVPQKPEPDPVKEGSRFVGWYTEEGSHYLFKGELGGDLTLHAVWEPIDLTDYTVKHYLKHTDGNLELILETTGYDSKHHTITVNALTNSETPFFIYKNLYVVAQSGTSATQTIDLSQENRTAEFDYQEMTEWPYTIRYVDIDAPDEKIRADFTAETDLLAMAVEAPTIEKDGKTWVPVRSKGSRLVPALAGAEFGPGKENLITIQYDVEHTLSFDLNTDASSSDPLYNNRPLIHAETTVLPDSPEKDGCIFMGWKDEDETDGRIYHPGDTFVMPDRDVTLTAQWALVEAKSKPGRLLDLILEGETQANIAGNGTVTAWFTMNGKDQASNIDPSKLSLVSENSFPSGTVITLIVPGVSVPKYYYYKVESAVSSIALTDFAGMGESMNFTASGMTSAFTCQVCVQYPDSTGSDSLCLSAYARNETAGKVTVNFGDKIQNPAGSLAVSENTGNAGNLSTTVTVSSLENLSADQSDSRHTHDTLAGYTAVLTLSLQDKEGKAVPFPKDSTVTIGSQSVKSAGSVVSIVAQEVTHSEYTVQADGLPSDRDLTAVFTLCAADDHQNPSQVSHPMRLILKSGSTSLKKEETPEYAVRAALQSSETNRILSVSGTDQHLTFDVDYRPADPSGLPSVTAYVKEGLTYSQVTTWPAVSVTQNGDGHAIANVTVPANVPSGTYRLVFTIGNAAYNYNLILTPD